MTFVLGLAFSTSKLVLRGVQNEFGRISVINNVSFCEPAMKSCPKGFERFRKFLWEKCFYIHVNNYAL